MPNVRTLYTLCSFCQRADLFYGSQNQTGWKLILCIVFCQVTSPLRVFISKLAIICYHSRMNIIDWTEIFEKYKGLWVALKEDEQTVVGSGKTLREALEDANRHGHTKPIMLNVPNEVTTLVGGLWNFGTRELRPTSSARSFPSY